VLIGELLIPIMLCSIMLCSINLMQLFLMELSVNEEFEILNAGMPTVITILDVIFLA